MSDTTRRGDTAVAAGGTTDWAALEQMTEEEIEAAAQADPEFPPLPDGRTMYPLALVKRIRWKLRLSREAFAERYRIPIATVVSWERYETEPDAVATAFLDAIAADPEAVARALVAPSDRPKAAE